MRTTRTGTAGARLERRARRVLASRVVALGALLASGAALACGVCIDDKVAATYDHAVITRAAARHRVVVFAALDGHVDGARAAAAGKAAAAKAHGVDPASVRVADNPAALSFALDPRAQAPGPALREIEKAAAVPGLRVTLLRVVE